MFLAILRFDGTLRFAFKQPQEKKVDHKTQLWGLCCLLLMGCSAENIGNQALVQTEDAMPEDPDAWGHSQGMGMGNGGNVDVARCTDLSDLRYWDSFWKTEGPSNYTVYDMTVSGQLIMSAYINGVQQGESECHWVRDHAEEESSPYYNSYLSLENVVNDGTPFSYMAVFYNGTNTYICASASTYATKAAAEEAIDVTAEDETNLTTGCNGGPWISTTVQ